MFIDRSTYLLMILVLTKALTGCVDNADSYLNKKEIRYNSGELKSEYFVDRVSGKIEGERIDYYKNGNIKYKANFKNGKIDGWEQFNYENGDIQRKIEYTGGKKNGHGYWYGKNKLLQDEAQFQNDEQVSLISYNPNGEIVQTSEIITQNGLRINKQLFFEAGNVTLEAWEDLSDSTLVYRFKEESGAIYEHRTVELSNEGDDIEIHYYGDSKVISSIKIYNLLGYQEKNYNIPNSEVTRVFNVSKDNVSVTDYHMGDKLATGSYSYEYYSFNPKEKIILPNEKNSMNILLVQFVTNREGFDEYNYEVLMNTNR